MFALCIELQFPRNLALVFFQLLFLLLLNHFRLLFVNPLFLGLQFVLIKPCIFVSLATVGFLLFVITVRWWIKVRLLLNDLLWLVSLHEHHLPMFFMFVPNQISLWLKTVLAHVGFPQFSQVSKIYVLLQSLGRSKICETSLTFKLASFDYQFFLSRLSHMLSTFFMVIIV